MNELAFYRQLRFDGGVRMGVELDGQPLFERFEPGPPELADEAMGSALQWYIDLRCIGERLPTEPGEVLNWFRIRSLAIQNTLAELAGELSAGIDDDFPIESSVKILDHEGTQLKIVCAVIRRIARRAFSSVLKECSHDFPGYLHKLESCETARM
jgi:hypothetical protein